MLRLSLVILPPAYHVGSILCHVERSETSLLFASVDVSPTGEHDKKKGQHDKVEAYAETQTIKPSF